MTRMIQAAKNGGLLGLLTAVLAPALAVGAGSGVAPPSLSAGDTAWLLTSTALVLFMTIPGLSLFYAGMVRAKNVLSMMMQCFAITALVTVLWALYGYSLAFDTTGMSKVSQSILYILSSVVSEKAFLQWCRPKVYSRLPPSTHTGKRCL
jgi:Amt family ammonium transporter